MGAHNRTNYSPKWGPAGPPKIIGTPHYRTPCGIRISVPATFLQNFCSRIAYYPPIFVIFPIPVLVLKLGEDGTSIYNTYYTSLRSISCCRSGMVAPSWFISGLKFVPYRWSIHQVRNPIFKDLVFRRIDAIWEGNILEAVAQILALVRGPLVSYPSSLYPIIYNTYTEA